MQEVEDKRPPNPPLTARVGQACHNYKCFKVEHVILSHAAESPALVPLDWTHHKFICKTLSAQSRKAPASQPRNFFFTIPSEPTTDFKLLHDLTEEHIAYVKGLCKRSLNRYSLLPRLSAPVAQSSAEHVLSHSTRTDQLIRMEAAMNGTPDNSKGLIPCPRCNLSFCCSPAHWDVALAFHHAPCEDARGDQVLSQCEMNREVRRHLIFEALLAQGHGYHRNIIYVPDRVKPAWRSLAGLSWESEFSDEMRKAVGIPALRWRPGFGPRLIVSPC
ncbi:hypothetical protein B0H19DRAFT_1082662 [Mycena capillaripes]|nr:hypothetical protein B0H19DRAFT_1082662 [Mycena capillaripes]